MSHKDNKYSPAVYYRDCEAIFNKSPGTAEHIEYAYFSIVLTGLGCICLPCPGNKLHCYFLTPLWG